jgi:hypothetical protein
VSERRQLNRRGRSVPCRFLWASRTHSGRLTNISFSGARISDVAVRPTPGSRLEITLFHEGTEIPLRCEIIYREGISLGVGFLESRGALMKKLSPILRDPAEDEVL